ncbi:hypothetical protein PoB_005059800 [Plakobranchus ocellatus]|uniref:Transmembrane protein n=1 Tax=Plakobranchus ocellatus TaxID=259542 RepID=A0AAV4BXY7_9GAST|nr:hypothetical protein PoB_005059800 [Plakobranchus ocellatus]
MVVFVLGEEDNSYDDSAGCGDCHECDNKSWLEIHSADSSSTLALNFCVRVEQTAVIVTVAVGVAIGIAFVVDVACYTVAIVIAVNHSEAIVNIAVLSVIVVVVVDKIILVVVNAIRSVI